LKIKQFKNQDKIEEKFKLIGGEAAMCLNAGWQKS